MSNGQEMITSLKSSTVPTKCRGYDEVIKVLKSRSENETSSTTPEDDDDTEFTESEVGPQQYVQVTNKSQNFPTDNQRECSAISPTPINTSTNFSNMSITQSTLYSATQFTPQVNDCTDTIREVYRILLQLLSNPEEFQSSVEFFKTRANTSTLSAFHADFDRLTEVSNSYDMEVEVTDPNEDNVPTPLLILSSECEVVLPQAHTTSQLFGYEIESGMDLEGGHGIVGVCQLMQRWLALMPGGDHVNIVEPPGLIVMKLGGGRYRALGAHRVVWRWNNELLADPISFTKKLCLNVGDLVTMTIGDVFETDCTGQILSYCPTFDNRIVKKTDGTIERLRKGSTSIRRRIDIVANSKTAACVNRAASFIGNIGCKAAVTVKGAVQKQMVDKKHKEGFLVKTES